MKRVSVIGLGMSRNDLTGQHLTIISESDVLVGGARHLSYFPEFSGEKIEVTDNLKEVTTYIQDNIMTRKITVIASGDPLFYGIGGYLAAKLGHDRVTVYPNISSVAAAFSRLGESWQDAELISLHGRPLTDVHLEKIRVCRKTALLTDSTQTPAWIWSELVRHEITGFIPIVLEKIGESDERIRRFTGNDIQKAKFTEPNVLILLKNKQTDMVEKSIPRKGFGLPEKRYQHEKGLITKPEVRAVSLSKLRLENHHVFWDLGAGSGSVSVEASGFLKTGRVISVEKNRDRIRDIEKNRDRFGVQNMSVIQADLPDGMDTLADPDRVFMGGGGMNLKPILQKTAGRMKSGGIIVVNTVLLDSVSVSLETLEELNFITEIVQVQVSRGHRMPQSLMLKSQNPVFIISGEKR